MIIFSFEEKFSIAHYHLKIFYQMKLQKHVIWNKLFDWGFQGGFITWQFFLRGGWIFTVQKIHQGRLRGHSNISWCFFCHFLTPPLTGVWHFGHPSPSPWQSAWPRKNFRTAKNHPLPPFEKKFRSVKSPQNPLSNKIFRIACFRTIDRNKF